VIRVLQTTSSVAMGFLSSNETYHFPPKICFFFRTSPVNDSGLGKDFGMQACACFECTRVHNGDSDLAPGLSSILWRFFYFVEYGKLPERTKTRNGMG
jgi:hypothetical protein